MDAPEQPPKAHFPVSLRLEVAVMVAALWTVGAAIGGTLTLRQMDKLSNDRGLEHGRSVLQALVPSTAQSIASHDYRKLDNIISELKARRHNEVEMVVTVDAEGRVTATTETGMMHVQTERFSHQFMEEALRSFESRFAFGPSPDRIDYVEVSMPIIQGQRWGTLLARFSMRPFHQDLQQLWIYIAIMTAVVAFIGWMVSLFLLDRLLVQPVKRLANVAGQFGEGTLDVQIAVGRKDELGLLADALNRMARRIAKHTAELETAVQERTTELREANRELQRLATTDGLTGLHNHRFFQEALTKELQRIKRMPHPLTLCMVDVDFFKKFNDTHGHPEGDKVLKNVAEIMKRRLRSTDILARYGGEEFAIILLDTPPEQGVHIAEELAQAIRETPFEGAHTQPNGRITASFGVASYPVDAQDRETLIRRADSALYAAKHAGRDQVIRFGPGVIEHSKSDDLAVAVLSYLPENRGES